MILVDTSVWIDFFNGTDTPHRAALHRVIDEEEDLALTGIVLTEVLQGFKHDDDMVKAKERLRALVFFHPEFPADYLAAATLYRACRKKGVTIRKTVDCLIAQIALKHGLRLLHRDADFDAIAGVHPLKTFAP